MSEIWGDVRQFWNLEVWDAGWSGNFWWSHVVSLCTLSMTCSFCNGWNKINWWKFLLQKINLETEKLSVYERTFLLLQEAAIFLSFKAIVGKSSQTHFCVYLWLLLMSWRSSCWTSPVAVDFELQAPKYRPPGRRKRLFFLTWRKSIMIYLILLETHQERKTSNS